MTPEQLEESRRIYIDVIKDAIKVTVNGKLDNLTTEFREHREETRNYIKQDMAWKSIADPYIKLAANISGVWKFLIYLGGGIITLLGVIVGIHQIEK